MPELRTASIFSADWIMEGDGILFADLRLDEMFPFEHITDRNRKKLASSAFIDDF